MKWLIFGIICGVLMGWAPPILAQKPADTVASTDQDKAGGVKSLETRVQQLEETIGRQVKSDAWYDRIQLSGLIEVEASYGKTDVQDSAIADEEKSDVDLATVELNADARIIDHVDGHIKIKYEDDDLFVDEGFIILTGPDRFPAYLIAGRQYIPFGNFETHFITDPNTLILGETGEGAVVAGFRIGEKLLDMTAGVFNGRTQKSGDDDTINSYVAAVTAHPLAGLHLRASYTSNLAGSDGLSEQVNDPDHLESLVGAWSVFAAYEFLERFKLIGEYVSAIERFNAGEIYFGDTQERKPSAWNLELGATLTDELSVALRYGGSEDGGTTFLPETRYGAVVNWEAFENTNLALEYLHGEYEDNYQQTDTVAVQLAVEF